MKIYHAIIQIQDDGSTATIDAIEYKGKFWLVPEWLEMPHEGLTMPARIILVDGLPHQRFEDGKPADAVVNCPIPKAVLNGETQKQSEVQFVVVERPDIRIQGPRGIH